MIRKIIQSYQVGQLLKKVELSDMDTRDFDSIRHINNLDKKVCKLVMPEMIKSNEFIASLGSNEVHYATSCNSTQLVSSANFKDFVDKTMTKDNTKYVFHNVTKDPNLAGIMDQLIPMPQFLPVKKMSQLRICRLYAGGKYSGTNLHNHSAALNYLVSGKKFWITFSFNKETHAFVESNSMKYGTVKDNTIQWLSKNLDLLNLNKEMLHLECFMQEGGQVVYLPEGQYHAIINLDDSIGITYSWN